MSAFFKQIGLEMKGQLCTISNDAGQNIAAAESWYDSDRRYIIARADENFCNYLFRIVGPKDNCSIYSVKFCEYLYPEGTVRDNTYRCVFSWRKGVTVNEGQWNLSNNSILSIYRNEFMYCHQIHDNILVATKVGGDDPDEGMWNVNNVYFGDDFGDGFNRMGELKQS
eukprot:TCONS_00045004-protein